MAANENTGGLYGTDEILWFCNGRWGDAGYAIPNPAGKLHTLNPSIHALHQLLGRSLFELAHRQDVRFSAPPHKQFFYDLHQLLVVARKRLSDEAVADNDGNRLETKHANPTPKVWIVYPVPFFGERIRQPDARRYIELSMLLLSEIMQHSDNDRQSYYTTRFAADVGVFVQEVLAKMAMKYFNKTREQVYAPGFALTDADFIAYDPAKVLLNVEMTDERPPLQWWPTENDLSEIRGVPITDALAFAQRYPTMALLMPAAGTAPSGEGQADVAAAGVTSQLAGSFVAQPGKAP